MRCTENLCTSPKFLQKPPPTFSVVHLLHRLYGMDAPGLTNKTKTSETQPDGFKMRRGLRRP